MKVNTDLTKEDMNLIHEVEADYLKILERIEKVKQFKLGDYVICIMKHEGTGQRTPLTNSYNVPKKFKVVHVDKAGIPYLKEVSSKGVTRGHVIPMGDADLKPPTPWGYSDVEYEHDPHFVESVILEAEGSYDPVEIQKNKKKIRDEITKHNADNKIKSNVGADLVAAFDQMKPGEVYWFSIKNNMTIVSTKTVPAPVGFGHFYGKKAPKTVTQIEVSLSTGKTVTYIPSDFHYKNLYRAQPRSYRELSDTI